MGGRIMPLGRQAMSVAELAVVHAKRPRHLGHLLGEGLFGACQPLADGGRGIVGRLDRGRA